MYASKREEVLFLELGLVFFATSRSENIPNKDTHACRLAARTPTKPQQTEGKEEPVTPPYITGNTPNLHLYPPTAH
jgi:hypothetical protein